MKCARDGCTLELIEDQFSPPGVLSCPLHGIGGLPSIGLETEQKPIGQTEFDIFLGWIVRLGQQGRLDYSVLKDMSGGGPTEIIIENHGAQEIDVRFKFDQISGHLTGVKCYTDRRMKR